MASKRFDVDEVLEAVFDSDFGLSDGDSSAGEDGDSVYAYLGDPVIDRSSISALTSRMTIDRMDDGGTIDDGGRTFDDEELVGDESSEKESDLALVTEETSGLGVVDDYSGDELFAATSRARETTSDNVATGESMMDDESGSDTSSAPDMNESPPSTSSSTAAGPSSTTPRGVLGARAAHASRSRGRAGRSRGRRTSGRARGRGTAGRARSYGRTSRARGRGTAVRSGDRGGAGIPRDHSEEDSEDERWEKKEATSLVYPYRCTGGPTTPTATLQNDTPLDIFCRFFTDDVWQLIVDETNRYASANTASTPHARPWYDTTVQEIKAFIGLQILMGIVELPRLELYWQTKHPLIATTGISSVMSLIRFEQLYRFLHLANSDDQVPAGSPGHDKLFKVRRLLDLVLPKFQSEYTLHAPVTIDEAMIPFKGRLSFKQYIKNKPVKWGIKAFVLSDAATGYVYKMQVYTGKGMETTEPEVGLCSRVVLDLMHGLENCGLNLYTDNYYTSPDLYLELYKRGINACGTVRVNRRGFPKELVCKSKAGKERGFYEYLSKGPLLAAVWFDRRFIYFLSTMHVAEASAGATTVLRHGPDGSQIPVECPPLLPDYQKYMRGVDKGDQMIGLYNVGRRSKK